MTAVDVDCQQSALFLAGTGQRASKTAEKFRFWSGSKPLSRLALQHSVERRGKSGGRLAGPSLTATLESPSLSRGGSGKGVASLRKTQPLRSSLLAEEACSPSENLGGTAGKS